MILVTGPAYAGKQEYICKRLGIPYERFSEHGIRDAEKLAWSEEDPEVLADRLSGYEIIIMTETGCGIVPADEKERQNREKAGRLSCILAGRADTVIRVVCGIPQILKGERSD